MPFISLQRMQDAGCRHFSAINFSAFYFSVANLPEFRLQPWVAGEARVGLLEVIRLVEEPVSKAGSDEQFIVGSSPTASALHEGLMVQQEDAAAGYPIASGVIEGACRHLVKDRMERTGMRWTLEGAQAMLQIGRASCRERVSPRV